MRQNVNLKVHPVDVTEQMIEDHVRTTVRESIADALKMEEGKIQDDQSFSEYGVDSIIAVNLVNGINKQFTITLETTVLFDYNNVDKLSRYIIREYKSRLVSSLQENVPALEESRIASQKEAKAVTAEMESHLHPGIQRKWRRNRFQLEDTPAAQDPVPRGDQSTYYRVLIDRPGEIEDLRLAESAVPYLKEHEVRIAVHAFSLNFGDLLCVKGLYPTMPSYPFTPGFEASGHVVEVGKAVTSIRQGDAVIVGMGEDLGGQASMITCSAEQVFPKPTGQFFEDACALPAVALTMIDAFHKAQLKRGERILIQTATGGSGLIAVQLAQHYGAEIFATAGSRHKLNYLEKLGVPHRINYRETDFESEIKRLTLGKGVDVVINTLGGDAIQKGMNCLAAGGRYIEIAMTALKSAKSIDLSVLSNNQTFYSVDLRKLSFEDPEKLQTYRREILHLVDGKIIYPTICQVLPLDRIKEAYRCLEDPEELTYPPFLSSPGVIFTSINSSRKIVDNACIHTYTRVQYPYEK